MNFLKHQIIAGFKTVTLEEIQNTLTQFEYSLEIGRATTYNQIKK